MIYIGTDIIKIARINKIIETKGQRFLSRIFTDSEQSICNSKASPPMFYGGKFAAKEAVMKALGTGIRKNIKFNYWNGFNDSATKCRLSRRICGDSSDK